MPDPALSEDPPPPEPTGTRLSWTLAGMRAAISVPLAILMSSFIGFAALALDAGVSLTHVLFMVATIWALPAKVVLVGAINSGAGVLPAAFAVALSSVRLTPMVVALIPELRTPKTRALTLYALSHFVAVTSWVLAMEHVRKVPRVMRTSWYLGLGSTLIGVNVCVVALVYLIAEGLPAAASAALLLMTPLYFLLSLWGSARERASHVAMVAGLLIGPVFTAITPEFALLATGLTGGAIAYGYHRIAGRRKGRASS